MKTGPVYGRDGWKTAFVLQAATRRRWWNRREYGPDSSLHRVRGVLEFGGVPIIRFRSGDVMTGPVPGAVWELLTGRPCDPELIRSWGFKEGGRVRPGQYLAGLPAEPPGPAELVCCVCGEVQDVSECRRSGGVLACKNDVCTGRRYGLGLVDLEGWGGALPGIGEMIRRGEERLGFRKPVWPGGVEHYADAAEYPDLDQV